MNQQSSNDSLLPSSPTAKTVTYLIYSQEQAFRHITRVRSEKEQALYMLVDEMLFYVWDAQSLSIDEEHREVYYPYLPQVFDLLMATEDGQEIVDYLVFIEETRMGAIKGDNLARKRAWRFAEQVLAHKKQLYRSGGAISSTSI